MYIKSADENEFWSALLEKAYAKLHGCYEAIEGGSACDAMVDFSGGCSEIQQIGDDEKTWDNVYNDMKKSYDKSSMIACSARPDPNAIDDKTQDGLLLGHAYSVTNVVIAKMDSGGKQETFPLVRLRNPWGNDVEWKGQWSDGSPEWKLLSEDEKQRLGLTCEHDGEFYMSKNDFMRHFDRVDVAHLMPGSLGNDEIAAGKLHWSTKCFDGSWIKGKNAGGCTNFRETVATNPQYLVVLEDSDEDDDDLCTCIIALMQKGTRKKRSVNQDDGCLFIGNNFMKKLIVLH